MLSPELERAERTHRTSAAQVAELPQFPSGLLVAVDQLVQLEHVDLAGVKADKAGPDSIEQQPQLLLVICSDRLPCRASLSSLRLLTLVAGLAHRRRVIPVPWVMLVGDPGLLPRLLPRGTGGAPHGAVDERAEA